jgi:hypothetical protein
LNPIKLMLPVQSSPQKYFASRITQIESIFIPIPSHSEGRFAIVTDVGCGMRWTRRRRETSGAGRPSLKLRRDRYQVRRVSFFEKAFADGEVVWS